MIGVYDYTVILTYMSLISGMLGIIVTVTGAGHPQLGVFFLMLSGILDAFDGKVARTKKDRTEFDKNFGIQIDSLTDLICFGILPVTIGLAQLRISGIFTELVKRKEYEGSYPLLILLIVITLIPRAMNAKSRSRSQERHILSVFPLHLPLWSSLL